MKKLILFSAILCILLSCKKTTENETLGCYPLAQVDGWSKANFKTNYTIQIPDGFEGPGMIGFEGNTFSKHSSDNSIILDYSFCDGLFCFDFGETLKDPAPNTVQILISPGISVTTNDIEYFCQNSETIGILYFLKNEKSKGKLFWKDNNSFKEALNIDFSLADITTVNKIIGTIKEK